MVSIKPQVVYFSDEREMVELITVTLSEQFQVTPVTGVTHLDEALDTLRQIRPDYVIVDPSLQNLDHEQLNHQIRQDEKLQGIQILIVREDP